MIFVMIASAVLSTIIVAASIAMLGRKAVTFVRTSKKVQQRVEPHVADLTRMAGIAQNRAETISGRSQLLQWRVFLLSFTLQKSKILLDALRYALEPIGRALRYVGL